MKTKRIQLKRSKGWRLPPNTVVVARPSKWGNPWRVGRWSSSLQRHMSNADAVLRFRTELMAAEAGNFRALREAAKTELRGKNLACWCAPGTPCHADVLLEIANT